MSKYANWQQLAYDMENDLKRFPLPICFDSGEEQRELFRRKMHIESIAKRWFKLYKKQ